MTNADRIRDMTDEKLGAFLCNMIPSGEGCDSCPASAFYYKGHSGFSSWLSMEAFQQKQNWQPESKLVNFCTM